MGQISDDFEAETAKKDATGVAGVASSPAINLSPKRAHERAVFEGFLKVEPAFAGEPLAEWHQPPQENDFPDIIGKGVSGKRVGVEIGEWLNQEQIGAAKRKEHTEEGILEAIGEQGTNPTRHVRFVWLRPKQKVRIRPEDAGDFREQLLTFILECDRRWPDEPFWKPGVQLVNHDMTGFPLLIKHLDAIKLFAAEGRKQWQTNWITFPLRGGVFDAETMRKPLRELVAAKIAHYGTAKTGFDPLVLLVYYEQAALYNSPVETPFHSYDEAVENLRAAIAPGTGPFKCVFLYLALEPGKVFRVV